MKMKLILILFAFVSSFALAQTSDEVTYTPPTKEQNESVTGAIAKPTYAQNKNVNTAVRNAKKKKNKKAASKKISKKKKKIKKVTK